MPGGRTALEYHAGRLAVADSFSDHVKPTGSAQGVLLIGGGPRAGGDDVVEHTRCAVITTCMD